MTQSFTQTAPGPNTDAAHVSETRLKAFIEMRLRTKEAPERIARAVRGIFGVALDPDQVVPYWRGEIALPTQTEHRPDKESVQFPADQPPEPNFTRMPEVETPAPPLFSIVPDGATQTGHRQNVESPQDAATQTGRRQNAESLQIPADPVDESRVTREAIQALGALAKARLGIAPDPAADATQTGRRQDEKSKSVLTDEMKAFIVRGLARYESPTRVAAAFQLQFGVEIDRRQVYAYDPAGSRPPARRWIDLHATTRAKFLAAASEIGIAQKLVRLRMLDRFAQRAEEANYTERAAKFLVLAARECGGFYERYQRPNRAAAPA